MPRDPQRIDGILKELGSVWKAHPDWRLGQVIANAVGGIDGGHRSCDPFYIEDELMLDGLRKLYKEY